MGDGARPVRSRSALRVVFKRNFFPYFAGNLVSNCGTWFQNLAQTLLIYRLTGSTFLVGVVNFSLFVGTFVLAPWSGSAADRFERRRLLVITQAGAAVITAILALLAASGLAKPPVVIGMAASSSDVQRPFRSPRCRLLFPCW